MFRVQRIPEDAIRHHPAIGKIHIRAELHRDKFVIHLNDGASYPAAHAVAIFFVVAIHFNRIAHLEIMGQPGRLHVIILRQSQSLRDSARLAGGKDARRENLIHHADLGHRL